MPHLSARPLRQTASALLATGIVFLCGCNIATTAGPAENTFSSPATISGIVHGGQQPVYNANVRLYSTGTSGYGTGSTLLATTTSDVNGNFQFTKSSTNGPSSGSGTTWACPLTGNPQIYITAVGGNTQGTGVTATNNTASALMAAIGACSTVSSATQVGLNEISTVASVFALAQYINPGTTPGTETVGTSSSTQGTTGINNAASTIVNLANIATGLPVTSNAYTGANASVTGVTITATPESAKLITIANILASCINTATAASTQCVDLFASASPPPSATVTSQPGATFTAALDTIQAAYYMATNPIDAGTFTACTTTPAATTKLACLFNLAGSTPPFQTGLSTQPTDWTLGIAFTSTGGTCTHDSWPFFDGPTKVAVDASGNLWFVNYGPTATSQEPGAFGGLSPVGQPLACEGFGSAAGQTGAGIAVDPTGNIWASYGGGSLTSGLQELPASAIATAVQGTEWNTPYGVYALAIDGNGDLFLSTGNHSAEYALNGAIFEFPSPGTSTDTFPATLIASGLFAGSGTTSITLDNLAIDHAGNLWVANLGNNATLDALIPTALTISSYAITSTSAATFYTTTAPPATFASGTQTVVIQGLATTNGAVMDRQGFTISSISTSTPYSITGTLIASTTPASPTLTVTSQTTDSGTATGFTLSTFAPISAYSTQTQSPVIGLAFDSSDYLYTGTNCCSSTTSDFSLVKITPNETTPANSTVTKSAAEIGGDNGTRGLALDGAANVWFGNEFPSTGTVATPGYYAIGEVATSGSGASVTFTNLSANGASAGSACVSTGTTNGCPVGGGFQKASFLQTTDLAIDPSGNVWTPDGATYPNGASVYNPGGSITEVVGAAVPTVTPLSVAAANGTLATKP